MVFALAGRRIDSPQAEPARFPLRNLDLVRSRLRALFDRGGGNTLICSAACGADLLALDAAGELNMQRRVILPFDREQFRETSVTDRPGDWGPIYDRVLDEVERAGNLLVESAPPGEAAYAHAEFRILEEAARAGGSQAAVVVWDGQERGPGDLTALFAHTARERGIAVIEISTLE